VNVGKAGETPTGNGCCIAVGGENGIPLLQAVAKINAMVVGERSGCKNIQNAIRKAAMHKKWQYSVTPESDGELRITWGIDTDVWDIHGPHYSVFNIESVQARVTVSASTDKGDHVAVSGRCLPDFDAKTEQNGSLITYIIHAKSGTAYSLTMAAYIYTNKDVTDPKETASKAQLPDYETALAEHISAREKLWEHAEVVIEGDQEAETALNYSLYHLMCIAPRHRGDLSIAARGLSGQTYKGAVFWDTEMFMLDFYLACLPEAAKSALNYRIQTLPGALNKAREYGFDGAFYAWESQEGDFDACSDYNVTDVFSGRPMRTFFKDKQMHISAAVAYGLVKYMAWTGEEELLKKGACETILQCARFYYSLLTKRVCSDVWEILKSLNGKHQIRKRASFRSLTAISLWKIQR